MKIGTPDNSYDPTQGIADLQHWLAQPLPHQAPVCPGCLNHKANDCSPRCNEAPRALSIDPDRYPIEPQVIPMVFQLYATRLIQPCWSCEGHVQNVDGEIDLWKLPQVSFYCSNPIYLQLLNRSLIRTQTNVQFAYPWHIVVSEFSQALEVTYSIQPNLNKITQPQLGSLQNDLRLLAENLLGALRLEAAQMIKELQAKAA